VRAGPAYLHLSGLVGPKAQAPRPTDRPAVTGWGCDLARYLTLDAISYPHLFSAECWEGSPKAGMQEEMHAAGSGEPASRRRKRASLYQPVVLRTANKVAADVLLLLPIGRGS
jgi:hypothetical protein